MKIPFDIKYRPQIESGEYKVETKNGNKVRILKFDIKDENYPIVGIVYFPKCERTGTWRIDGGFQMNGSSEHDLVLIVPEPKLTESEDERIRKYILRGCKECIEENNSGLMLLLDTTKKLAAYLEKQEEQKQGWSDAEYGRLFDIEHYLDGTLQLSPDRKIACIDFLKSLRPQPKEDLDAIKKREYERGKQDG